MKKIYNGEKFMKKIYNSGEGAQHTFRKKLRRAFTITELVIVIAVVAILAAVLIPTFSNIIKKADESADTQLVKNLNTILSSEQTVSQEAAPTMSDALAQAQEGGYTVDKLTPTSDGDILWEQDSNRFVLVSDGKIIFKDSTTKADVSKESYKFWKITNEDGEIQSNTAGYSYYLGNNYSGGKTLNVKAGLDVGGQTIEKITYATKKEQTVVFNTTGGTLEIDAEKSDVKHYGSAEIVTINSVDYNSYHLYGSVTNTLTVEKGRVYFEASSSVSTVKAQPAAEATTGSIVIDGSSSAQVGAIVISSTTTTSVDVSDALTSYITEDSVVGGNTLTEIGNKYFSGGMGTENNPFKISDETDLLNVNVLADEQKTTAFYFTQTADINVNASNWWDNASQSAKSLNFNGIYDGGGNDIKLAESFSNITVFALFSVTESAVIKNVNLYSAADCLMAAAQGGSGNLRSITLDNVDAYSIDNEMIYVSASNAGFMIYSHLYPDYDLTLTITNCDVRASITNTGDCTGVFMGGCIYWGLAQSNQSAGNTRDHRLIITNCTFSGEVYGASQAGLIFGNGASATFGVGRYDGWTNDVAYEYIVEHMTIENVKNNGVISSAYGGTIFGGDPNNNEVINRLHNHYLAEIGGTYRQSKNILQDINDLQVSYDSAKGFTLSGTDLPGGYTYKLEVSPNHISASSHNGYDGRGIMIDISVGTVGSNVVSAGGAYLASEMPVTLPDGFTYDYSFESTFMVGIYVHDDGKLYFVLPDPGESGYPKPEPHSMTISVIALDASGTVCGQKVISRVTA